MSYPKNLNLNDLKLIDHIPQDFDLQPSPMDSQPWAFVSFMGAIAILLGILITGEWE